MNIDGVRRVCVVGWGRSGIALVQLLRTLEKQVFVSEVRERANFSSSIIDTLRAQGVRFEFGGHSPSFIKNAQLVVTSPGVNVAKAPPGTFCRDFGIPCVGEVEFSFWFTKARCIAITGTNGKTTTAFLTYRVLKEKRKRVFLGGNIGIPLSSFILRTKRGDLIVLEISSFQLETIIEFRPFVAALLNIEPDHLDRYPTFDEYFKAKLNIFRNQTENDWALLNGSSDVLRGIAPQLRSKTLFFSTPASLGKTINNVNFSCAYTIGRIFGVHQADCLKVFSEFRGLPHRLQLIRKVREVSFINDSKATNPSSTRWALERLADTAKTDKPYIILIVGGKDKGLDYRSLTPCLKQVRAIHLLGEAAATIQGVLPSLLPTQICTSLEEAVQVSFKAARPGDTVLFSPMCSSFDMFSNYRERGKKFIDIVQQLA